MDALYETLNKDITETEIKTPSVEQKEIFLEKLKQIDSKGNEIIYVLIKTHQKLENSSDINNLPYDAKELKMGIKFNLDNLPIKLFYILNSFINKHISHLNDENNRKFLN
jgi:ABC-type transporter Mla MlaB component